VVTKILSYAPRIASLLRMGSQVWQAIVQAIQKKRSWLIKSAEVIECISVALEVGSAFLSAGKGFVRDVVTVRALSTLNQVAEKAQAFADYCKTSASEWVTETGESCLEFLDKVTETMDTVRTELDNIRVACLRGSFQVVS